MFVLGLQGSPRKKGNTNFLLTTFLNEAESLGAHIHVIDVDKKHILPCKEYIVCEKKGVCPIDDDMKQEIYPSSISILNSCSRRDNNSTRSIEERPKLSRVELFVIVFFVSLDMAA